MNKASYTLEAAVVLPLVAGFWVCILIFFRAMEIQLRVQEALTYAGRKAAVEASIGNHTADLVVAESLFYSSIAGDELLEKYVRGGIPGISLLESQSTETFIDLRASYQVRFPVAFFDVQGIPILQESKNRKWTGEERDGNTEDPLVYITEYGEVYHVTKSCQYLDLTIKITDLAQIEWIRNKNGEKYHECSLCVEEITDVGRVFITDYGEVYHESIRCSGLKRTIWKVHLSQVGTKRACSKCGGS